MFTRTTYTTIPILMRCTHYAKVILFTSIVFISIAATNSTLYAQTLSLEQAKAAAVQILVVDFDRERILGSGSGSLISTDGHILTNHHVIAESAAFHDEVIVKVAKPDSEGEFNMFVGKVIKSNSAEDLALVQITSFLDGRSIAEANFPTVPLGDSDTVQSGDDVYAIGYPDYNKSYPTVTSGIVSGKIPIGGKPYISTDALISYGNSGGLLVDRHSGELIGVPTLVRGTDDQIIHGYARPVNIAKRFIDDVELLCADNFATNINQWPIGFNDGELLAKETIIARGSLQMAIEFNKNAAGWINAPDCFAEDFFMQVDAKFEEAADADVGIILLVRHHYDSETEESHYLRVIFYADNSYKIDLRNGDQWKTLQKRTRHTALRLRQGDINALGIMAMGDFYHIYANETELVTFQDSTVRRGGFGLGAIGPQGTDTYILFDNFGVAGPPPEPFCDCILSDSFDDNHNDWLLGPVTSDNGDYSEDWIRNGQLEQQTEVRSQRWISWSSVKNLPLSDFYLKVDAAFVEATSEDSWLHFILRYDETTNNYYRIRFDSEGYYIIDLQYDGEWHTLQTWTRSRAIHLQPGETSTVELWLRGEYLTIAVNGIELTTVQDDRWLAAGTWGLGNGGPEGTKNIVIYDNLLIKETPE